MLKHIYDLDDVLVENLLISEKDKKNPKEYLIRIANLIKGMSYRDVLNYVMRFIKPKREEIEENSCIISNNPFAKEIARLYFPDAEVYPAVEFEVQNDTFTGRVFVTSKVDIVKKLLDKLDNEVVIYTDGYTKEEEEIAEYLESIGKKVNVKYQF